MEKKKKDKYDNSEKRISFPKNMKVIFTPQTEVIILSDCM